MNSTFLKLYGFVEGHKPNNPLYQYHELKVIENISVMNKLLRDNIKKLTNKKLKQFCFHLLALISINRKIIVISHYCQISGNIAHTFLNFKVSTVFKSQNVTSNFLYKIVIYVRMSKTKQYIVKTVKMSVQNSQNILNLVAFKKQILPLLVISNNIIITFLNQQLYKFYIQSTKRINNLY